MSKSRSRPGQNATFALLMLLAALMMLLPAGWTNWLRFFTPATGWLAWTGSSATRAALHAVASRPGLEAKLQQEIAELEMRLGQQSATIEALAERVSELTGIRDPLAGADARIVVATVLGGRTSPYGDSLTISVPRAQAALVRQGDWVAATTPGSDPSLRGWDALTRSWIIGRISEEKPGHLMKVQLTTDPGFGPERVRAARRLADGTWQLAPRDCLIYGNARQRMTIRRADQNFLSEGFDLVLLPVSGSFPAFLMVGTMQSAAPVPDNALFFDIEVRPWGEVRNLSHVYILVLGR